MGGAELRQRVGDMGRSTMGASIVVTPRNRERYRKWSWFALGLAFVPIALWVAFILPAFSHPAHSFQTCQLRCVETPASQFYLFLWVATGSLLGLALVLVGLAAMARRIARGRMTDKWTMWPH